MNSFDTLINAIQKVFHTLLKKSDEPHPLAEAFPHQVGFSFAPAGLLMPYHLGVLEYLKFAGILTDRTPLAGASAGALAVACTAVAHPIEDSMNAVFVLEDLVRATGARAKLKEPLVEALEGLLPPNAHELFNCRPAGAYVTFSTLREKHMVRYFTSREDLLECIVASCNIPFYLSRSGAIACRGMKAMDGFFADPRNFGCPDIPGVFRHVRVLPFAARQVASHLAARNTISPDLALLDAYIPSQFLDWFEQTYLGKHPAPRRVGTDDGGAPVAGAAPAPFDIWRRFVLALNAAQDDQTICGIYDAGRRDAFRWVMCNHLAGRPPYHQGECLNTMPHFDRLSTVAAAD